MKQSDEGIFIHRIPYSESSAIVSYYTKKSGFQKFLFLGGRKKNTQLFALNIQQLSFFKRPDSELGKLTAAESLGLIKQIPFDPIRSSIAYFVSEVCQKCLSHTEKDEELYHFLVSFIEELDTNDDLASYPHLFLLGLTPFLGIQPQIESDEPQSFHLGEGVFSSDCLIENAVRGEEMQFLFALYQKDYLPCSREVRKKALEALLLYYRLHIEQFGALKSLAVLEEIYN